MQDRMEKSRLLDLSNDERERFVARERELQDYRNILEMQQREFDEYRRRAQDDQHKRESELRKEIEEREAVFAERERRLMDRQKDFERHLARREAEAEKLRERLKQEVTEREEQIQAAMFELAQEKERYNEESRKKIERTSKDYVSDALQTLDTKEQQFHKLSKLWSITGALALAVSIGYFVYLTLINTNTLPAQLTWEFIAFAAFKGVFVVALLAGLAKYSFIFSRSYMQESLKNADRRHAINFGKFYLESYGAAAEWSQVKEAFEHWNITSTNAFGQSEPNDVDFSTFEKTVGLIERAGKALTKPSVEKGA